VVTPILLLVALALTAYFSTQPLLHAVQLTSHFSISLPLLVCGATGVFLAFLFTAQICRKRSLHTAYERMIGHILFSSLGSYLIRRILHEGGRKGVLPHEYAAKAQAFYLQKREIIDHIDEQMVQRVEYRTRDNICLRGYWKSSILEEYLHDRPTIIFFHGSGWQADISFQIWNSKLNSLAEHYIKKEYNVLFAECRGYGLSDGAACGTNQELEAYYDAEAALKFVLDQGVKRENIVAHGHSLGAVYAASLAAFFDVTVILDHPFTSLAATISHLFYVSIDITKGAVQAAYRSGEAEASEIHGAKKLVTDGFDNVNKLKMTAGRVLVIQGKEDILMPCQFGKELIQARYTDPQAQADHLVYMQGGHMPIECHSWGKPVMERIFSFIKETKDQNDDQRI
jgi:pimeloyl-ACP methyl ester carboxylesterase